MKILEIYEKYRQLPNQADHQFTVAAVAKLICDNCTVKIDTDEIVKACLLHDMGNIVKYNFDPETQSKLPKDLNDPATFPYWEKVKQEVLAKYGSGSHNVTMKIVDEIGVSPRVRELVNSVGFSQGIENEATPDLGKKICAYADMRVMPKGIASLEERLADLRIRYANHPEGEVSREAFEAALRKIEQQIFTYCKIKPEDVTSESIKGIKEQLKNFEI